MNIKLFRKNSQNTIYCLVATKSSEIISKIIKSKSEWIKLDMESDLKTFLFVNNSSGDKNNIISFSAINDFGDYDISQISAKLTEGNFVLNYDGESLISLSSISKKHFACMTDFWGIMTHYWFKSENTFICSNNIFIVSSIIGKELCKDALYEYLFFLAPRKDKTWFENIKCLLPGQQLIFDIDKSSVKLSNSTDFSSLFKPYDFNFVESVEEFFLKVKEKIEPTTTNNISLSAGSDSRTILSCLRHFGIKFSAISFGKNDMVETHKINRLIKKLTIPWQLVNLEGFEDNFNELFTQGTFISNGLLNPFRSHYMIVYDQIKRGDTLFEGFLGSEFVKGEIAVDSMISKLHNDVIANGISITETIEKHYPELSPELKVEMSNYINSNYGAELLDINSSEGLKCYQRFSFEYIPCKFFGGLTLLELAKGIFPYYPFLSPKIIRSIFKNKYGMSSNISLRNNFNGPIKCLEAEAKIVKFMDKQIFNSLLDRNIKFKDVLYPLYFANMKRTYYLTIDRLITKKHLKSGQMDNTKIFKIAENTANTAELKTLLTNQNTSISNPLLTRSIVNLCYVLKLSNPKEVEKIL